MLASGLGRKHADQIAQLLNQHNNLQTRYNGYAVIKSDAVYYPLHLGDFVLGSVAVQRVDFLMTEVKHLVIHPMVRGFGIGKKLVAGVLKAVTTPLLYAKIRADNVASRALFNSLLFREVETVPVEDHNIVLTMRKKSE